MPRSLFIVIAVLLIGCQPSKLQDNPISDSEREQITATVSAAVHARVDLQSQSKLLCEDPLLYREGYAYVDGTILSASETSFFIATQSEAESIIDSLPWCSTESLEIKIVVSVQVVTRDIAIVGYTYDEVKTMKPDSEEEGGHIKGTVMALWLRTDEGWKGSSFMASHVVMPD